tara:strand:+ start:3337 stop:3558 length:222 start_codon:yes stop_codon:yes gene_type:complete
MSEARYLGLLNEVKRLRADMQHSSNEGGRVDPLRVALALDSMIKACEDIEDSIEMLKEFKDSGFTDDFGIHME